MKRRTGIFISVLFALEVTAQQNKIDNPHQLLAFAKEDTAQIDLLNQLSSSFTDSRPDSALIYATRHWNSLEKLVMQKERSVLFFLSVMQCLQRGIIPRD